MTPALVRLLAGPLIWWCQLVTAAAIVIAIECEHVTDWAQRTVQR